jgi:hypothetical protein
MSGGTSLSSLCSLVHGVAYAVLSSGRELFWFYIQSNFDLVTKAIVCWILLMLLLCAGCGVWVLLNDFPAMAKGGRRGVSTMHWLPSWRMLCLASRSANLKERSTSTTFLLCKSVGSKPLFSYLCTTWVNSWVHTVVMLVLLLIIKSTLRCGHDEWCVMIIYVSCVFSKLLRPIWISK